nr:MAG: bel3 [simian foamy virus Pan troglodytes schweinfurthii]
MEIGVMQLCNMLIRLKGAVKQDAWHHLYLTIKLCSFTELTWQTSPILGLEKDILLMVIKQLWKLMDLREEVTRRGCGGMPLETRENKEESITGREVRNLITQILLLLIDVPGMRDTRFLNCPHSLLPLTSNAGLLKHCLMAGKWSPKAEMIILAAERSEH